MRGVAIREPGAADVLEWTEVADIEPGAGEILVEVAAAGVNRADLLQRQGFYPPPPGASPLLGLECSGVIAALGPGVDSLRTGDRVTCLLSGGGYAERVAVPVGQAMRIPEGVDLVTAAALPEVACTVWSNLVMVADLEEGETVLIHGGASGVGTMAIQIARALGARVAVTAGSEEKLERCDDLGAEILINYRTEDFVARLLAETGGRGADVILDNMGASYLARNVEALTRDGRIVVIGLQGGVKAELDLGALLRKGGTLHATSLRARSSEQKTAICAEVQRRVWPWIDAGIVEPVVDRVLPMDRAAEAHRLLEAGDVVGKVLLTPPTP